MQSLVVMEIVTEDRVKGNAMIAKTIYGRIKAKMIRKYRVRKGDSSDILCISMRLMVVVKMGVEDGVVRNRSIEVEIYGDFMAKLIRPYRARLGECNGLLYTPITQVVVELIAIKGQEQRNKAAAQAISGRM